MQRVTTALDANVAFDARAEQGEVAEQVEHLVAHELVREAQAVAIQHAIRIEHDGVVEAGAARATRAPECVDLADEAEGARARDLALEGRFGEIEVAQRLAADAGVLEVDLVAHAEAAAGLDADPALAVADLDRARYAQHVARRRSARRFRRPGSGTRRTQRCRPCPGSRGHRPRRADCRCRARRSRRADARPCRASRRRDPASWRGGPCSSATPATPGSRRACGRSVRTNTMPDPARAGCKVSWTGFPVCSPTPVHEIFSAMVRCRTALLPRIAQSELAQVTIRHLGRRPHRRAIAVPESRPSADSRLQTRNSLIL